MVVRHRDVWPPENETGEYHWAGTECPCCPWSYVEDRADRHGPVTVVVHGWFTEQIIHIGTAPVEVDEVILDEVTW